MTHRKVHQDLEARHGYRAQAPKCRSGELTKASVDLTWIEKDKNRNLQACVDHIAPVNATLPVCLHIDRRKTGMHIHPDAAIPGERFRPSASPQPLIFESKIALPRYRDKVQPISC